MLRSGLIGDATRCVAHTYRGWTDNMRVINAPWDFNLTRVRCLDRFPNQGSSPSACCVTDLRICRLLSPHSQVASLRGPGRIVVTTAPDDTTNPPPMQKWVADHIAGAELLQQAPGWGHAHAFVAEVIEATLTRMMMPSH